MKRTAKLALRNRAFLADALPGVLPREGTVLELGSGTGEHAVFLAARFPALRFQPSDPDPEARASIGAWAAEAGLPNLRPALDLDLRLGGWTLRTADAVLCVNVLHAAPDACGEALVRGAASVLPPGGPLVVYGPFLRRGAPPPAAGSRLARLEAQLRAHDPALGLRERETFLERAAAAALRLDLEREGVEEGDLLLVLRAAGPTVRPAAG